MDVFYLIIECVLAGGLGVYVAIAAYVILFYHEICPPHS